MPAHAGAAAGQRRVLVTGSTVVIALIAAIGLWSFTMADHHPSPAAVRQPSVPAPDARRIMVEPIPVAPPVTPPPLPAPAPPPPAAAAPARNATEPAPASTPHREVAKDAPGTTVQHAPREAPHRPPPRKDARPAAPPTREQLGQKFQQIRREYDEYKSKFGSRLENEWGDLATFIQYMPANDDDTGRKEAARRLDAFQLRMRE